MNAHNFSNDWDYYDSLLTPAQKMARDITEGEAPTDILEDFWECYASLYGVEPVESKVASYALEYSTHYFKIERDI